MRREHENTKRLKSGGSASDIKVSAGLYSVYLKHLTNKRKYVLAFKNSKKTNQNNLNSNSVKKVMNKVILSSSLGYIRIK